jgi:hypothetical protein
MMKKIIHVCDFYGKHVSLYTKSSSKATTCIGFVLTIISFLLLGLIIYIECYEVLKREHPNVVSYKQAKTNTNSTLSISNKTFNFFIYIDSDYQTDNLLSYFNIESFIQFENADFSLVNITFEKCNAKDKLTFKNYIENFEFPDTGINLCPRINYKEIEKIKSFYSFHFYYVISECTETTPGCTVNKDLYDKLRKKETTLTSKLSYINNELDLTNYDNPYSLNLREFYCISWFDDGVTIELEGSEIHSQELFSFNTPTMETEFSYSRSYSRKKVDEFVIFNIAFFSNDMYIYKRTYKTFNTALATSFALFGFIDKIISILLGPLYKYYISTIIINKNFSFESESAGKSKVSIGFDAGKEMSVELKGRKTEKLTTVSVFKNVSLFRYVLCKRKNMTKTFYDQAKCIIKKNLSVENLLSVLVEYYKLRKWVINKEGDSGQQIILGEQRLILNNDIKNGEKELELEALVNLNNNATDFRNNIE